MNEGLAGHGKLQVACVSPRKCLQERRVCARRILALIDLDRICCLLRLEGCECEHDAQLAGRHDDPLAARRVHVV